MGLEDMDWIHLTQHRVVAALVNRPTAKSLRVPYKSGGFLEYLNYY
jgi:hypothetical protein